MPAQTPQLDLQELQAKSTPERLDFTYHLVLERLDSADFISTYQQLNSFAKEQNDWRLEWDMQFYYFLQRGNLGNTNSENIQLLTNLEEVATAKAFKVGVLLSQHFLFFEKYYFDDLPKEVLYTKILEETEEIQALGFEKFFGFPLDWILYHNGKFLYELGDYEKSLQVFQLAEQVIQPTERHRQSYILVLNHLQSIFQKRQAYSKAVEYAKKILQFVDHPPVDDPQRLIFYRQWKGLASLDIAAILVKQGKNFESEAYARVGYNLSKAHDSTDRIAMRLEYDALQVLVSTKLKTGQIEELDPLFSRLDELYQTIGKDYENYFNNIEYFEHRARFHELKGQFAESVHYANLAKPLKDSLARRNDARHLEQLKQRLEVEKYTKRIHLAEQQQMRQKWLSNVYIVFIIIVLIIAFIFFGQLLRQRQKRIVALKTAKTELEKMAQRFRAKSVMAENLLKEMEKITQADQRSEYLEKLTNSTILTDKDWLQFRQVFEKAYPGFIEELKTQYPSITPAELRYLTLEKLHLSTNEMANILGISDSAVRKTRARFRKKVKA